MEQHKMARFTRKADGWTVDGRTRGPGRGAYLCSSECATRVAKNKRFPGLSGAALSEAFLAPERSY
ncbi:MAG: DUF448 domain-containing protein [Candidatus Eremiobacteraeota bacterium]|nr:DUF448 domain-containing protein [Candidatus Eremiobacteraeota bacterium]